ncbi:NAD-dependent epimerase/dehydratase family protein [Paenibacillus jiagnxiensis]|uniref:NAD-dependent epimerase/dehydratase family protein n=1 Tax=Paenibacillus jiagnxiensis TaxID=3228926 RepID=UPI0033B0EF09
MTTKALVTGATGFLGRHAALRLAQMGWDVSGMGRSRESGAQLTRDGIRFVQADMRDADRVVQACAGQDYVFHCAALSSPWGDYREFYGSNVLATRHIIEGCRKHEVKRLIHISTPSIYFNYRPRFLIRESEPLPARSANAYAATKLLAEREVMQASREGLPVLILRPRAIFGPLDRTLFPRLLQANGKLGVPMLGGGQARIDLTYVDNVVDAMLLGCSAAPAALGQAYNISNGEPLPFREVVEKLFAMLDIPLRTRSIPYRAAYGIAGLLELAYRVLPLRGEPLLTRYTAGSVAIPHTLDITLAREQLGYKPSVSVWDGLQRFADWWVTQA